MGTAPVFARSLKRGDIIAHLHPAYGRGSIVSVHTTGPLPARPWGVVAGWMECAGCSIAGKHSHAFNYPAESLIIRYGRAS